MRFKGTALMAAVFMSLVLYYFFVDVPAEQKEKKQQEQAEKLLPFQAEEVVEFSLTGKGEPISLRRKDLHKWELALPLTATGDTKEADSFISEIENLKKTRVVEENPKDLSIYGLSSPLFKIHFKLRNKQEETLLIGDETPLGGSLYFMRKNHPEVMMAKSSQSRFEKTVYDFRDKTLLNFSTGSIRRIQIISENNPLELKRTDDTWEISGNIHARGDKDAIMNFLQSIQFSRVKHFVNENPESLEPYGLNSPTLKLVLGDDATHTLSLGTHKAGKGYYAKVNNSKNIVLVEVAGEVLVLGMSQDHIALLTSITDAEKIEEIKSAGEKGGSGLNWNQITRTNDKPVAHTGKATEKFLNYMKQFSGSEKGKKEKSVADVKEQIRQQMGRFKTARA